MPRVSLLRRALAVLSAGVLLLTSVGFAWAVTDDWAGRDVVPLGVEVAGADVGGLTRSAARDVVEDRVAAPLLAPLEVRSVNGTFTFEPESILSVDVDGMVDAAFDPKRDASLPQRVWLRVSGEAVSADVEPMLKVDEAAVAAWVDDAAARIDRAPVDATFTPTPKGLRFVADVPGYRTDRTGSVRVIADALKAGTKTVLLPAAELPAKIRRDGWGKSILVVKSQRRLRLYNGSRLEKVYGIAVGTPGYPTPSGRFKIVNKRYRPGWSNPGSAWAKDMPAYIPPGPGNPLGTRALDLDAAGIRIHGTSKDWSIGTAASHGCMRMHMWDVEDLFPRVPVGTRVIIIR